MPGESNAFEATARRVTHDWMRHLGYTDDAIEKAENMTCEQAGCQMFGEGHWDHSDENGDSLHPERDELDEASEFVVFVLGHPHVARDDTAELVEAADYILAAAEVGYGFGEAVVHLRAALARVKGEQS